MKDNFDNIDDYLLGKWINEDLNEQEAYQIAQWINLSENNKDIYKDVSRIKKDLDQLNLMSSFNSTKGHSIVKSRIRKYENKSWHNIIGYARKIAAVIVLPLIIYSTYSLYIQISSHNQSQLVWQEIYTPVGLRSNFQLPDGTKVTLNGNTKLEYPSEFKGNQRLIKLQGEAFFEVISDKSHPFIVNTKHIDIQAVGTKFNVKAYDDDPVIETALLEGKVNLLNHSLRGKNLAGSLSPSELALFNINDKKLKVIDTNLEKYLAWKDGILLFQDDSFTSVLRKLAQWYNVKFDINPSVKKDNYVFTGAFHQEGLHQVLKTIELTTPVQFTFVEINRNIDTINYKRTIIVTSKNKE